MFFHLPRDMMTNQQLVKFTRKLHIQFLQYDCFNVRDAAFPIDRNAKGDATVALNRDFLFKI